MAQEIVSDFIANPEQLKSQVTTMLYVASALAVTNVGAIFTMLGTAGRVLWWFAKLDSRVEKNEKDVTQAHQAIREIRKDMNAGPSH